VPTNLRQLAPGRVGGLAPPACHGCTCTTGPLVKPGREGRDPDQQQPAWSPERGHSAWQLNRSRYAWAGLTCTCTTQATIVTAQRKPWCEQTARPPGEHILALVPLRHKPAVPSPRRASESGCLCLVKADQIPRNSSRHPQISVVHVQPCWWVSDCFPPSIFAAEAITTTKVVNSSYGRDCCPCATHAPC
jgi:hypothetical protein